jgi:hypothetical protein
VKNDISEELGSLSALIATISRETPYQAPEGYFLSFPTVVLESVQTSLPRVAGTENAKPLTFSVPEGYFEGLAQQVLNRIKTGISNDMGNDMENGMREEAALPAIPDSLPALLVQAGRRTPYTVPEGYFDGLSPLLAVAKDKNPYLVPVGYFDQLEAKVVGNVAGKVLGEVAGNVLGEVGAEVAEGVGAEVISGTSGRVVSLGKRMSWMKYAAAAVVAGLIVTIGWLRWRTGTPPARVAGIQAQQATAQIAKNLTKVSDQELQNFLVDQDTTLAQPVTNNAASMAALGMDDSDMKTLLGDVPDGELKAYLEEHGGAGDIATN